MGLSIAANIFFVSDNNSIKQMYVKRLHEAAAILIVASGIYLFLSLFSYYPNDPSWANTYQLNETKNLGGIIGAWTAHTLYFVFGYATYLLTTMVFFSAYLLVWGGRFEEEYLTTNITRGIGGILNVIALCGLLAIHFKAGNMPASAGGWVGEITARGFANIFGDMGATLLLLALLIGSMHLLTSISWLKLADCIGAMVLGTVEFVVQSIQDLKDWRIKRNSLEKRQVEVTQKRKKFGTSKSKERRIEPAVGDLKTSERAKKEKQIPLFSDKQSDKLPSLELLKVDKRQAARFSEQSLDAMANQLELKLADFRIEGKIVKVQTGPIVTCFELSPAPGTKARQITNLEKDLARALSVPSVRVVEVIPGKAVVGIEIPNEVRETVLLKELLSSEAYDKATLPLNIALGKDTVGDPVIINLRQTPHLLVAGTTGSGKSVAVHSMLMSILFKSSPKDVRLILIDPKMLELNAYEGIPHLLTDVITDMKEATTALRWAVVEMDRRYEQMLNLGVRNLESYNRTVKQMQKEMTAKTTQGDTDGEQNERPLMPYIVVVIDEFADIMMSIGKPVEDLITRLAQKARAAGIHLIIATQRPSVDVITGLIKANIPSRIAFQVSSKVDSRTILDQNGAEQLLGQGDMLYLGPGYSVPTRIHGAFVSDSEVSNAVNHWSQHGESETIDLAAFLQEQDGANDLSGTHGAGEKDPLYDEAVEIIRDTGKVSTSYIQRRLRVGYNRAADMVETMERQGIVSAVQPNGKREVLVSNQTNE